MININDFVPSDGYFTWMSMLTGKSPSELERSLGYKPGALGEGWLLLTPRFPLTTANLDFRGSTRWCDGRLPDGKLIGSALQTRIDLTLAAQKVIAFFDRGLQNRPTKVLPLKARSGIGYQPAPGGGMPQFKLASEIEWRVVTRIPANGLLDSWQSQAALQ